MLPEPGCFTSGEQKTKSVQFGEQRAVLVETDV